MKRESVTADHEQDKWLHRLLRQRSATQQAVAPTSACLDADVLAAWADGVLGGKELTAAERHVAGCPRCLALLAAIERTAPAAAAQPHARRLWLPWLVPLTAAATAVAIWVAIPRQQMIPVAREVTSAPAPVTPSPAASPLEAPQVQAKPQPAPGARVGDLSAQNGLAREERALDDRATVAESAQARENAAAEQQRTFAAPASSPAPAADARNERLAGAAQGAALKKESTAEAISPGDPLIRWRVRAGTDVERSIDGGKSWVRTSQPPASVSGILVVDALNATVITSDGRSFSTADGGATWAPVQEKPAAPF